MLEVVDRSVRKRQGNGRIGWAIFEMLRNISKGFLENVTIEELTPDLFPGRCFRTNVIYIWRARVDSQE
jgi:hypothetical protein